MTDTVVFTVADGVATIAMNRPERRNSFTFEMADGLLDALERSENDPAVGAVVLTSTGAHWGVGRDNADAAPPPYPPGDHLKGRTSLLHYTRLVHFMYDMNTPTIAEIRGGCAGAHMSFALSCDFRYADSTTVLSPAFIKVAFAGDLGASWHLTRLVGPARAKELMLLSPKLRGQEIADYGLVNEVLPPDELSAKVRETAARIASYSANAVASTRRNLLAAQTLSLGDYLPLEAETFAWCAASPDAEEARLAFIEKRAPRFGATG
ncbi:enoyl-CoA hydratase/isomerase family protein [Streptomyces sp. NPDC055078]